MKITKKASKGIVFGAAAGVVDVVPMILQDLSWDANMSAFFHWVIAGYIIGVVDIEIHGALRGIFISFLLLMPTAILIGWSEPMSLLPIAVMSLILGSILGYLIDR